jgi:hypothetical protein
MDISIEKVSVAVLGVIVISVVFAVFSGSFNSIMDSFLQSISFPSVGP